MSERINLSDVTFMIPVRIDSADRAFNLRTVLAYLDQYFSTNVIVHESGSANLAIRAFPTLRLCKWVSRFEKTDDPIFHRTRLLNEMLSTVTTPIVVNYDADVLLRPESYSEAAEAIRHNGLDLVYPYQQGQSQRRVTVPQPYAGEDLFDPRYSEPWASMYGFVQFFRTQAYRDGGMENEEFLSYGAEDVERGLRFQKLGYRVEWKGHPIWHLEHSRGPNSSPANPHFRANEALMYKLKAMTVDELRAYYATRPYLRKYAHA